MDIAKIAKLANLTLTPSETTQFSSQLDEIINYVDVLKKVDISNTEPTSQVTGLVNVTRADKIKPCLKLNRDYFRIPAIFDHE